MKVRSPLVLFLLLLLVGGAGAAAALAGHNSHRAAAATPKRGGSITIARIEDSQSFDKTNVFQNESIWLAEQIMEPLYTVGADGKTLKPWLATSYTAVEGRQDVHLQAPPGRQVLERQDDDVGGRQVLDRRRTRAVERAGATSMRRSRTSRRRIRARSSSTSSSSGRRSSPTSRCSRTGSSRTTSPARRGRRSTSTRSAPGPFMWDKRVVGQSVTFKRNPFYWQKGKPYLDSVTWKFVTDENTRELQLRGGQIQVDEFPPFNSITKLQHTSGRDDDAVPVDAHGLSRHEREVRAAGRRARPSRDLLRDRPRRRSSSRCCSASASRPTRSCRRRCRSTSKARGGLQFDIAKAKAEMAKSKYPKGFKVTLLVGAGAQVESAMGQILQQPLKQLGINVTFKQRGHVARSSRTSRSRSTSSASATGRWTSPTPTSS